MRRDDGGRGKGGERERREEEGGREGKKGEGRRGREEGGRREERGGGAYLTCLWDLFFRLDWLIHLVPITG
jgi:hypothetical protein